ncbi:hypothetical protein OHQ89_16035 [Streptomyces canus]|uniref:hypothetical protein n=1 Tax=Streptomyces canus TaxID=58343 RepID=UPI0030E287C7
MDVKITKADLALIDAAVKLYGNKTLEGEPVEEGVLIDSNTPAASDIIFIAAVAVWAVAHQVHSWIVEADKPMFDLMNKYGGLKTTASLQELLEARNYIAGQLGSPPLGIAEVEPSGDH